MKSQLIVRWGLPQRGLRFLIIILLLLGIVFRFININRKSYSGDEVNTSLRMSGYTLPEMSQQLRNGRVLSIEDLQKYQYPSPEKGAIDTVRGIALEDSQQVPLYFIMVRFWVKLFGNSVAVTRSMSAFISLLAFPCIYWLCQELFESQLTGWIAMILIAVSPLHVLFAQIARGYSAWVVAILLSSIALLRAIRLPTKVSWVIYAATVSLGLYSHLYFSFVAIGHGIYVIAIERFRLNKTLTSYLLASLAGFLAFGPWIWVIISNFSAVDGPKWATITGYSPLSSAIRWAGLISRAFVDLGVNPSDSFQLLILLAPSTLILLILVLYSIYFLCRQTPKRVWLFVLTLIGVQILVLMLPDLIFGWHLGTSRFLFPCILGIQLSVTYLIATQTTSFSISSQRRKLWQIAAVLLISSGVLSCAISSQAKIWWNIGPEIRSYEYQVVDVVNQATQPLLISDSDDLIPVQTLSYLLEPKVRFQLVPKSDVPTIPDGFSDVFLYNPSESLRSGLERVYNSQIKLISEKKLGGVFGARSLWKLENRK